VLFRYFSVVIIAMLLQACGSAHVRQGSIHENIGSYKQAYISEISVTSKEQNVDALDMNQRMQEYAKERIEEIISSNSYEVISKTTAGKALAFKLTISVVYGNRAARYFGGFGAGKGTVSSRLQVVDSKTNAVVYSASAESELSVGAFGGSMETVLQENIDKLLDTYPKG
jgi:hypothetical protein